MRILFVSNSFPNHLSFSTHPTIGGTQRRLDLLIHALKSIAQLDVLFYVPPHVDCSAAATAAIEQELSDYWQTPIHLTLCPRFVPPRWQRLGGLVDYARQPAFVNTRGAAQIEAFNQCLERRPDAIVVQRLQSIYPALTQSRSLPPLFFDLDDIEHVKVVRHLKQSPMQLKSLLQAAYLPALWLGERRAIRAAQRTFVCSESDVAYLTQRWGLPRVISIPNAIAIPPAQPLTADPTLLLLGTYNYPPNRDAANFLIEQVLPRVQAQLPQTRLIIAGVYPDAIRSYSAPPQGVEFTGFVKDLEALYQRSRVVCCPIFSGGGTRIKLIEAAAHGKPIVATSIGVEGVEMTPGQDFLLANTADEFANACLQLLTSDPQCASVGAAARSIVVNQYNVDAVAQQIHAAMRSVLATVSSDSARPMIPL